ncbi:MAG: hypothetical protein CMM50_07600 [Rhodospirillaceae bacterium]|nr:hypothetical protein [Rhodospirillaceae bacterium]|tara:strand:+ start:145 stop:375 length:231 start_codon:yes stop_codon:yes gene_type:complete
MTKLTASHIRKHAPDADDTAVADILATGASIAEFEQAAVWARGDSDIVGDESHALTGRIRRVYEILTEGNRWAEEP